MGVGVQVGWTVCVEMRATTDNRHVTASVCRVGLTGDCEVVVRVARQRAAVV